MTKPLSAFDSITLAFTTTKRQLFSPFRGERWLRLAVVCLIIGDFASGGGVSSPPGGFNIPHTQQPRGSDTLFSTPDFDWSWVTAWAPWIAVGVGALILFVLLWIYIASVYRFVLFDSVLNDRCQLKGSWGRWERCGRSYFFWTLGLTFAFWITASVLFGVPLLIGWEIGVFKHPGDNVLLMILGGVALFFLMLAMIIVGAIIALFAKDFCVPIMAMENVGTLGAWRRLLPMLAVDKWAYTLYVFMKIVLAIGSAIMFGIITVIIMIVLLVGLAILGLIVYLVGKGIGLTLNPATMIALVLVGGVILTALFYLLALISTPPMVFFQSYTLNFFGSRYSELAAVMFPEPEAPPAPPLPPPPLLDNPPAVEPSFG